MMIESCDFFIPPAFEASLKGITVRILQYCLVWEKISCCHWCGYPMIKKWDRMFSHFNTTPACNKRVDGHLVMTSSALCIASRDKNHW